MLRFTTMPLHPSTSGLIGDRYVSIDAGGFEDLLESGQTVIDTEPPVNRECDGIGK